MISPIGKMIEPTKAYLEIHSMKRLASPPDEILVNCRVPLHNMIAHINLELTYFHMYFVAITVSWVTGTEPIQLSNTRNEDPLHYLSPLLASVVSTVRLRRFPTELLFGYLAVICLFCFTDPGNGSAALHYNLH